MQPPEAADSGTPNIDGIVTRIRVSVRSVAYSAISKKSHPALIVPEAAESRDNSKMIEYGKG